MITFCDADVIIADETGADATGTHIDDTGHPCYNNYQNKVYQSYTESGDYSMESIKLTFDSVLETFSYLVLFRDQYFTDYNTGLLRTTTGTSNTWSTSSSDKSGLSFWGT